jgi:hypothetical protein
MDSKLMTARAIAAFLSYLEGQRPNTNIEGHETYNPDTRTDNKIYRSPTPDQTNEKKL